MKIYVVMGYTGEYDDECEWIVAAYEQMRCAEDRAIHAKAYADRIFDKWKSDGKYGSIFPSDAVGEYRNPYDEGMKVDYTGTTYMVVETELHRCFNETH